MGGTVEQSREIITGMDLGSDASRIAQSAHDLAENDFGVKIGGYNCLIFVDLGPRVRGSHG